jgi:hypothetical protein
MSAPVSPHRLDGPTGLLYAVDTFVPVADFNLSRDWLVDGWLAPVRFLFVGLGWLCVSVWIAGLGRVLRQ